MKLIGLLSKSRNENSIAVITPSGSISYKEFEGRISFMIEKLLETGLHKGSRAAILSKNSLDYAVLIFALWRIGAVPVPLNVKLLPKEVEEQIEIAHCRILFTGDTIAKEIKPDNTIVVKLPKTVETSEFNFKEEIEPGIEDTAVIIFTSGSTGTPKGVELSFNNLIQSAVTGDQIFRHREGDRWLASLPFYHVGGLSVIIRCFYYGAALIIPASLEAEHLSFAIEKYKPTLTSLVTTQLKRFIDSGFKPNPELRHVLLGGGFIDPLLVKNAYNSNWNVSKSYGITETASFVTALSTDEFRLKPDSAGKALPPNQILIVDEDRNPLPSMRPGEIAVKAQSVAKGYFGSREESSNKFSGDIFYSGDYGWLDEEGYLFIEARRNDLIVSGGENISPFEVEKEILIHPNIKEACVFGIEDDEWGQAVAAAIVTKNNSEISLSEMKDFLNNRLPGYKQPKKIFLLDQLPKTELGKVQKEKVRELINSK